MKELLIIDDLYLPLSELCKRPDSKVTVSQCLAIIKQESNLRQLLSVTGNFYKNKRLPVIIEYTGLKDKDVQAIIGTIPYYHAPKPNVTYLPIFRFEERNWEWASKQTKFPLSTQFLLSCSFGIAQKSMREYTKGVASKNVLTFIHKFKDTPGFQLIQLVSDLSMCFKVAGGDFDKTISYYHSGKFLKSAYVQEVKTHWVEIKKEIGE